MNHPPNPKTMSGAARSVYVQMAKTFEDVDLCSGCLSVLDPDYCCCGGARNTHASYDENHAFTPMGCICHTVYRVEMDLNTINDL